MAEVIYARPNMMTKVRYTQGEREERIVDIYASIESVRDQRQDYVGTEESSKSLGTGRSQRPDYVGTEESSKSLGTGRSQRPDAVSPPCCPVRAVVVLLGLLSVVLLAGLLGLAVKYKTDMEKTVMEKNVSMDRDKQLLLTLKNLTLQRDALICQQCCPNGWDKFGCKCYFSSNTWLSWNKSREFCVSHGADLVVVDSKEEMDFISRMYNIWLGATDEAGEGMWRWVDGTVLSLDNPSWSRRGPDGGEDKNCLELVWEQNQYKWGDKSCEASKIGLCEHNLMK